MESKIKMVRKGGYTVLPNRVLRDETLTLQAKGLFCMMASFPEGWDFTTKGLAKVAGCGRDKITAALKNLRESGYLLREQGHSKSGRFDSNIFILYDEKITPLPENPATGKTAPGNPSPENPPQINKEGSKERKNKPPIVPREVSARVQEYAGEDQVLHDALMGLLENRAALKKPVKTLRAMNGILRDLFQHSGGDRTTALLMLDKATKSNWLTVYPLKADELPGADRGKREEAHGWQE